MVHIQVTNLKRGSIGLAGVLSLVSLLAVPLGSAAADSMSTLKANDTFRYVALGDSVAAGLGLSPVSNATTEDTACGRSPQAYSTTVADGINAQLSKIRLHLVSSNVACQGAVVGNLTGPQTVGPLTVRPQLDAAFAAGTPALLTLTIGANDVHWSNFIGACFSAANCDTTENTAAAHAYVATMQNQLTDTLASIRSRSAYGLAPITVVTGYYNPVSTQCVNPNLSIDEVNWLTAVTAGFNTALQAASHNAGWFAKFAPVDFTGHDICSADPWIQRPGVAGEPAAFHPNAQGQKAMGNDVLHVLGL
ncbi:MAG TPA: SGNH/GDSL hydrolase family protein [Candidatus Saccharimonadales bacterium]|nr:SGNH/GDSL hydrolase family protein [Candidatus Saccharimonadales bacterium]